MRHASKILLTLCILLCASCGGAGSVDTGAEVLLTDVLTLELAFGADNLPEEYLLTFPEISFVGAVVYIGVDNNGNIFVADDSKIKIYDSNGLPLKMFGGLGYGPGEFGRDRFTSFNISANGYLTQQDGSRYNIFRPDQTLVESKNYLTNVQLKEYAR
ncbi:hypothetical protein IIB79_11865, partial [candidate division KSB1 bacterium]|nr:hypothetical protein [candidate division KSB1 bacterium]